MNFKLYVVFVLACSLFRSAQGLMGADLVKVEDFSYNVKILYYRVDGPFYHSGSIINKRFIMTSSIGLVNVTLNDDENFVKSIRPHSMIKIDVEVLTNRYTDAKTINVTKFYLPQKWINSNNTRSSIAILELKNDLNLSRGNIQILKLPTMNIYNMKEYEKFAVLTGSGSNTLKNGYSSGLRSMEINIVDCPKTWHAASDMSEFCGSSIILHENINNSRNQSLGVWGGDEGSPLVYRKNTIIGIVTDFKRVKMNGHGDDRLGNNSALYTNVWHHLDFINDVISGQPSLHIAATIPLICTAT